MRLVFIVTHGVTANLLLRGQLAFLRSRGFDITVIASPGAELDAVQNREGVRTIGIPMSRSVRLHEGPRTLASLVRELRRIQPDVVNASTSKAGLLGMLASYALRIPRRIYLVRGLRFEGYSGIRSSVLAQAERVASACATDIVCVSNSVASVLVRDGLARRDLVQVIPSNGIDVSRFRPRAATRDDAARIRGALGIPNHAFVAGFVGRLVADKGVEDMLAALERLPDAWFLVVGGDLGGDQLSPRLAQALRTRRNIVFTGRVTDPAPYYAAMDTLLFPSYREGLPNVPLEAAASEIPVVGYRVTGMVDAVRDGLTGTLVPKKNVEALGDALFFYAANLSERTQHGAAARRYVSQHFAQTDIWQRWATLYESANHARSGRRRGA